MSKRRKKRDVFQQPDDPKFRDQWYLVSRATEAALNKELYVFPLCLSDIIQDCKLIEPFVSSKSIRVIRVGADVSLKPWLHLND